MHLLEPESHLPRPLRDSKLPWKPLLDDQAAVPRDGDGWTATLGDVRLELELESDPLELAEGGRPGPCSPSLRLVVHRREVRRWSPANLASAAQTAEALVELLLEQLASSLPEAPR